MVVTDDFTTGTDQDLASRSGWANNYGANVLSAFSASNSLGFNNSAGSDCLYYYSGTTFADDQYAQATISALPSGATSSRPALLVRRSVDANYVGVQVRDVDNTGATTLFIYSNFNGNLSSTSATIAAGDVIRLEASGTNYTVKINGSTVLTGSESTSTAGAPGFGGFNSTASNGFRWDNFEAGDLASGGSSTQRILVSNLKARVRPNGKVIFTVR